MSLRGSVTIVVQLVLCLIITTPVDAGFAGSDVFLPSVGAKAGVPPSVWYTTVWVHNPGASPANITVYLLERQANTAPLSYTDTIEPGGTRKYEDAVQLMFGKQTFGALRITSNEKVVVSCRVYSQEGVAVDESKGQFFAGVPASFAVGAGESTEIIGGHQTRPSADSDFRFNFGFVEVTGSGECQVEVTVKDSSGTSLGSKTYTVRHWEQLQVSFASEFGAISSENARLTVEVLSGEGRVIAFGSSVANGSQDASTVEMAFADELLTENSTGAISGVTAGAGLAGGGTSGDVTVSVANSGIVSSMLAEASVTPGKIDTQGATDGQVLKAGPPTRWQDDGLTLPFEGAASNENGAALKVTNNGSLSSTGIEAYGGGHGGVFENVNGSGQAFLASYTIGIAAYGTVSGGLFVDSEGTGSAYVGFGSRGIRARGDKMGGEFWDNDSSGYAEVATGDFGIIAYGDHAGGAFEDTNESGWARAGAGDTGVWAKGNYAGGSFGDLDSGVWGDVAHGTSSTMGNGSKNFVQNHPEDPGSVIVYAAPEGDEVATYTRGTARLVNGEARVPLGETFRWVTNPDIGLTTYLTPVGEFSDLYVAEKTTEEIVVRSVGGAQDATFDYMVYGLRIGFEKSSIVQERKREAYIPSMADHRQLYEHRPDLERFNALERFKTMRVGIGETNEPELGRARALKEAIVEFDPAVHELPGADEQLEVRDHDQAVRRDAEDDHHIEGRSRDRIDDHRIQPPGAADAQAPPVGLPVDIDGNVHAPAFISPSRDLASLIPASEAVEPGDVLAVDRERPGFVRRAFGPSDTGVVGVVTESPGIILGGRRSESRGGDRANTGGRDADASDGRGVAVAVAGVVRCKADAAYGAIWPGDLLVTSPTPGHAMRADAPLPGTILGKALETLEEGREVIEVLVTIR